MFAVQPLREREPASRMIARATLALTVMLIGSVGISTADDWALVNSGCQVTDPNIYRVSCGNYGAFLFASNVIVPGSCQRFAGGVSATLGSTYASTPPGGAQPQPVDPGTGDPPFCPFPTIDVIDFLGSDTNHGAITTYVAGSMSGDPLNAAISPLNAALYMQRIGPVVSDRHLAARLCQIVTQVESIGCPAPRVVSMSFGRFTRTTDQLNPRACTADDLTCQIARLIARLKQNHGTVSVAAIGNNGIPLFPAKIADVLAVGMVDVAQLSTSNVAGPVRETATGYRALAMGQAICPRDTSPGVGSSFAASIMAGEFAYRRSLNSAFDPTLYTGWHHAFNGTCWELRNAQGQVYPCNPRIDALYNPVRTHTGTCWQGPDTAVASVTLGATSNSRDYPTTFEQLMSQQLNPTPFGDPCVPCMGGISGTVLNINMSQSGGFPAGTVVDSVQLQRDGLPLIQLNLSSTQKSQIAAGTLGTLSIQAAGSTSASQHPSLIFNYHPPGVPQSQPGGSQSVPIVIQ